MLENKNLQMILHAGDLSYADCQQTRWDSYAEMVQILAEERCVCTLSHAKECCTIFHSVWLTL